MRENETRKEKEKNIMRWKTSGKEGGKRMKRAKEVRRTIEERLTRKE